jgi:hypothetical protein
MTSHRRKKKVALALEFRMFPRSEEKLSFLKIAEYWSREIRPLASRDELLAILEAAWWRGELIGKSPRTRLQLLQIMFGFRESPPYQGIVFVTPNDPGRPAVTELKNGEVGVDQSPRINVPCEAEDWTEDSCATAFSGLAEASSRKHFPIVSPVLCSIEVAREEFLRWVEARGFDVPRFWKRNSAAHVSDYRTGAPGRPSSSHLVEAELDRRISEGTCSSNATKEAKLLAEWLKNTHPSLPPMTAKTIHNTFRKKLRDHINARK